MDFNGKIALITGASRGLGAAVALALGKAGCHVIMVAKTTGGLEELDDAIQAEGGTTTIAPLDLNNHDGQAALCSSIFDRWGGIDLWVHCSIHAAPLSPAPFIEAKDFGKSVDGNITQTQRLITNVDPLLQARKGTAVLPIDNASGAKFYGSYGATKAAQQALWASWAAEAPKLNITTFAPEPMPTATRARFYPGEDRDNLTPTKDMADALLASLS